MKIRKLPLNVIVIGERFTTEDFQIIQKVHGPGGEITIRPMKAFLGQDSLINFMRSTTSMVYLTTGVDKTLIESIKDSGQCFGDLSNTQPLWFNIKSFGDFCLLDDIVAHNKTSGARRGSSFCGTPS